MNSMRWLALLLVVTSAMVSIATAATPPSLVNYQGVLRDPNGVPITGTRDMVFVFFDDPNAEYDLLYDSHTGGGAVVVDGGLFNVTLGGGVVGDGASIGEYFDLASVFRDFGQVWLEIWVAGEMLAPRVQLLSAPYALNASSLDGKPAGQFLDSSPVTQAKSGALYVNGLVDTLGAIQTGSVDTDRAEFSWTTGIGRLFPGTDPNDQLWLNGGNGNSSIRIKGLADIEFHSSNGDYTFWDDLGQMSASLDSTGNLKLDGDLDVFGKNITFGSLGPSIDASGGNKLRITAGYTDTDSIWIIGGNSSDDGALLITGNGNFEMWSGSGVFKFINASSNLERAVLDGDGNLQLDGDMTLQGNQIFFGDPVGANGNVSSDPNGMTITAGTADTDDLVLIAGNDLTDGSMTIQGDGSFDLLAGNGTFNLTNGATSTITATLDGPGNLKIDGDLTVKGGQIFLGYPILASGYLSSDLNGMTIAAGTDFTDDLVLIAGNYLTDGSITIQGAGSLDLLAGNGTFNFTNGATSTMTARLDGPGNLQIDGSLSASGNDPDTLTLLAYFDKGILARGTYGSTNTGEGGRFCDTLYTGEAELADGNTGVVGLGSYAGGIFSHRTTSNSNCTGTLFTNEVRLATATSAIESAAPKNFVQNHPYDPTKLIVYTSLEGDEVGTYTRGVARLQRGVARVPLGETFAWVTNPSLGLTAHVTPRGEWNDLYVESVTTSELVVRSRDGARDGVFDYLVHGLRVGFEHASVVRERDVDAYIPPTTPHDELYARRPELRPLSAGDRFKAMHEAAGQRIDVERGRELVAAIGIYNPEVHGAPRNELLGRSSGTPAAAASNLAAPVPVEVEAVAVLSSRPVELPQGRLDPCRGIDGCALFVVDQIIEPGELLALDPQRSSELVLAAEPADPGVIGVAMDRAVEIEGRLHVPVISHAFAEVKADAGYGAIHAGDLLTASGTPGHAMRSGDPRPGTVIGKAIEPLEAGTGVIRVLLMMR